MPVSIRRYRRFHGIDIRRLSTQPELPGRS